MNLNKYTEKAQEAVLGAQQLAERSNHPQIEPEHLLVTLVEQPEGIVPDVLRKMNVDPAVALAPCSPSSTAAAGLRRRAAGLSPRLRASPTPRRRKPAAQGRIRQHRAPAAGDRVGDRARARRAAAQQLGVTRDKIFAALTQIRGASASPTRILKAKYQALERYGRDLTELARKQQARSGDRPRRGDPPGHPGALPPHEEQSCADRRARRRQDGDRRRPRAAHHPRRRARRPEGQAASSRSTWARWSRARSIAASSRSG